ncbi:MAG: hypothetical protein ABH833_01485 [Parcubacteria group bacterium]
MKREVAKREEESLENFSVRAEQDWKNIEGLIDRLDKEFDAWQIGKDIEKTRIREVEAEVRILLGNIEYLEYEIKKNLPKMAENGWIPDTEVERDIASIFSDIQVLKSSKLPLLKQKYEELKKKIQVNDFRN